MCPVVSDPDTPRPKRIPRAPVLRMALACQGANSLKLLLILLLLAVVVVVVVVVVVAVVVV